MCLNFVDKKSTVKEGSGWKIIAQGVRGNLHNQFAVDLNGLPIRRVCFKTGVWIKDRRRKTLLASNHRDKYATGFHIWKSNADLDWCTHPPTFQARDGSYCKLFRVDFRAVTATGLQSGKSVIVAKEMYIHPEEK